MNQTKEAQPAPRPLAVAVMLVTSILLRLIPGTIKPPNFAPVGALGVFGGTRFPVWLAVALTIIPMVISDLVLHELRGDEPFDLYVYASFPIYLLLGRCLLRGNDSVGRICGVSFLGSLQFFLITNFGYWVGNGEHSILGLLKCYRDGLPFFGFTFAGDLGFCAVLFGAEAWLYGWLFADKPMKATAEVAG